VDRINNVLGVNMNKYIAAGSLSLVLICSGCANMSSTEQRTLSGAAIGTAVGAGLGAVTGGNVLGGAAIGAAAGTAGGYLYDRHKKH
jgi:osmotically inducible lipoprotein OsmB